MFDCNFTYIRDRTQLNVDGSPEREKIQIWQNWKLYGEANYVKEDKLKQQQYN